MVEVTAAIITNGSKKLIARRGPLKHLAGFWEFPGGKVEKDESPEDCLKREVKEELGIEVKVKDFITQNIHQYGESYILLKAYNCNFVSGEIQLKDHDMFEWIDDNQFANYRFAPADIPIIDAILHK